MIAREIRLVCTNGGAHRERELALLVPYGGRIDLALLGSPEPFPDEKRRGFVVRWGTVTRHTPSADGVLKHVDRWNAGLENPPAVVEDTAGGPLLHVPRCTKCRRPFGPYRVAMLAAMIDNTPGDRETVDVSS